MKIRAIGSCEPYGQTKSMFTPKIKENYTAETYTNANNQSIIVLKGNVLTCVDREDIYYCYR